MADAKTPAEKPAVKKAAAAKPAAEKVAKPAADKVAKPAAEKVAKPAADKVAKADNPATAKAAKPAAEKAEKPAAKAVAKDSSTDDEAKVSVLRMHHLRPAAGAKTAKTRVGRGQGSKGKTAGRGTKGTGARYQIPDRFEGGQTPLHMRIPKLRGFRNPNKVVFQVVNLDTIGELYPKGGKVTKDDLVAKGAVRKNQLVKVLGDGDISVKVTIVDADKVSQSAKTKIEAAGGSVQEG